MSESAKIRCSSDEYKSEFKKRMSTSEVNEKRVNNRKKNGNYNHSEETKQKISKSLKGRKIKRESIEKASRSRSYFWKITYPSGKEEFIRNLSKFCKDNNLRYCSMLNVSKGTWKQYKGWICEKIGKSL